MGPVYQVTVEQEGDGVVITGEALIATLGLTVPDLAAQALALGVGMAVRIFERPRIEVRRLG